MNKINLKYHKILILIIAIILILILSGCATFNQAKSNDGKIMKDDGKVITVNIGNYDDPKVGETYKVFYYKELIGQDPIKKTNKFQKRYSGEVRITELQKNNQAKGVIVSGKAKAGYKVELKDRKFEKFDYRIIENILY